MLSEVGSTVSIQDDLSRQRVAYMEDRAISDGSEVMVYGEKKAPGHARSAAGARADGVRRRADADRRRAAGIHPAAPAATQEGGGIERALRRSAEADGLHRDSITAGAVGARAQGVNLSAEAQNAEATVYAVGSGYFDVTHETLLDGRLISEADVKRAENVVVIDERMALSFFAGNEPVGQTVTLSGLDYEVAGVIKAERRLGETNEHIAYIPITSASANALAMQTVEMIAKTADKTTGSAILMENTLKTWQPGGVLQLRQAGARRGDADSLGGALCGVRCCSACWRG